MSGLIASIATGTVALVGSISSFSQAAKQNKKIRAAETEAKKAMAEAKKRLEVNVMEQLAIKKEPYEQQIMAMLTQGQAGLQAGVEGEERGVAATAGRTYMGQLTGQERVRTAMGQELQDIELAKIQEEARLADIGMGLNLQEAEGAQEAAANAEMLRAQAIQQGFEGLIQAGSAAASAAPLYGGGGLKNMPPNPGQEAAALGMSRGEYMRLNRQNQRALNKMGDAPQFGMGFDDSFGSVLQGTDFSSVGGLGSAAQEARALGMGGQRTPEQLAALRQQLANDPNFFYKYP